MRWRNWRRRAQRARRIECAPAHLPLSSPFLPFISSFVPSLPSHPHLRRHSAIPSHSSHRISLRFACLALVLPYVYSRFFLQCKIPHLPFVDGRRTPSSRGRSSAGVAESDVLSRLALLELAGSRLGLCRARRRGGRIVELSVDRVDIQEGEEGLGLVEGSSPSSAARLVNPQRKADVKRGSGRRWAQRSSRAFATIPVACFVV